MTRVRSAVALLALLVVSAASSAAFAQSASPSLVGDWSGALDAGVRLRLVLHVTAGPDGTLAATLECVDQGATMPADSIAVAGGTVTFAIARIQARFTGTLDADGQKITGTFTQGLAPLPLVLTRGTAAIAVNHPQEPKPPFPYRSENVSYPGGAAGVTLAGTLTLPPGAGPFPAVLLVTGSGAQDRDETLLGHRPFLVLADRLTRAGIAVLRVDDRGVGGSTGTFATATTLDFAADAEAGLRFLTARGDVDRAHVGLLGHSEGGLIAPLVASRNAAVSFIVMLAGPGVDGEAILLRQQEKLLRASGVNDAAIVARRRMFEAAYAEMKNPAPDMPARVEKAFTSGGMSADELKVAMAQLSSPWFRAFLTLDPALYLRQVKVPVLALNGALDLQVDSSQNLPPIRAALAAAGNTDVEAVELPGLNHLFQHAATGLPAEYGTIEETMSPEVLEKVTAWIVAHTKAR